MRLRLARSASEEPAKGIAGRESHQTAAREENMNQITQFLISHGGLFLFVIGFAEQNGLPLPGAPWLLAAGALSASGKFNLFAAIGWTAAGSIVADAIWFFLGHRGRARVFRLFPYLQSVQVKLARKTLARTILHGLRMLTVAKFLPVGNSVVAMQAGALEVSRLRFLLVDALASVVYASVYASLGFAFHNQLEQLLAVLQKLGTVSLVLLAVGVAAYVVHRFVKRHPKREALPHPEARKPERRICFP
jgi:membrane protein DedA with SNARE-associated domain